MRSPWAEVSWETASVMGVASPSPVLTSSGSSPPHAAATAMHSNMQTLFKDLIECSFWGLAPAEYDPGTWGT
ncbi:hypothetical protein [Cystobacter fuscus]|uniref:hypothetical protein n=1 Tax=Cystobacter fuscus TaxID=43 RepID=UPI002B3053B7|nr:hypothetical protein F0U63_32485 [Cystobacter fuscus]